MVQRRYALRGGSARRGETRGPRGAAGARAGWITRRRAPRDCERRRDAVWRLQLGVVLERTAMALAIDPSLDLAHVVRMRAFYHLGFFEEARREGERTGLNPAPAWSSRARKSRRNSPPGSSAPRPSRPSAKLSRTDAPAVRHYLGLARYYPGDGTAREMLASAKRGGRLDVRAQPRWPRSRLPRHAERSASTGRGGPRSPVWITTWPIASGRHWRTGRPDAAVTGCSTRPTPAFPAIRGSSETPFSTRCDVTPALCVCSTGSAVRTSKPAGCAQ